MSELYDEDIPNGHVEEAKEAAREEARAIGKRTVWAVLFAFLIFGGAILTATFTVANINHQACADRQEGREGIRELVLFVVGPEPRPDENVRLAGLRELVAPGGKLGPINC